MSSPLQKSSQESAFRPFSRPVSWMLFLLTTYVLSLGFHTFKVFTLLPSFTNGLIWLGVMLFLGMLMMTLTYDSYVHEKAKGRIQKPMRLFEWLIQQRFLIRKDFQPKETVE